jgi:hypothetical protein
VRNPIAVKDSEKRNYGCGQKYAASHRATPILESSWMSALSHTNDKVRTSIAEDECLFVTITDVASMSSSKSGLLEVLAGGPSS